MKRLAFFIAVLIGLNATSLARRPEEEGQAIVQHDNYPSARNHHISIIQLFTEKIAVYFYAVTKEGIFHWISWERIVEIVKKHQENKRVTTIVCQYEKRGNTENSEFQIF